MLPLDIMLTSLISNLGDLRCLPVGKVEKDSLLEIVEENLFFFYGKFRNRYYQNNHLNILIIN